MFIDFHVHLHDEPGYAESLAEIAQSMGLDRLCVGGTETVGLASNDAVMAQCATYPELFVPVAAFPLGEWGPRRVGELARQGFRGLCVSAPPAPYDDERFFPVYEAAQAEGLPVLFHTGLLPPTPADKALDVRCERMRPVYLDTVARFFPELQVIGAGLGAPWFAEACQVLRLHENVFYDLSGAVFRTNAPSELARFFHAEKVNLTSGGSESNACTRLLFGSGVRCEELSTLERDYQRFFRSLALKDGIIERIMGENAARLLGLGE